MQKCKNVHSLKNTIYKDAKAKQISKVVLCYNDAWFKKDSIENYSMFP